MKSYCVSSLDSFRKDQIQTMVNTCTAHDHTSLSFPFEDASLFLFSEYDGRIVSAIAFVPVDDLLFECSAFTDPEFRGQGLFSALLDQGIQELPEDSELLFYVDQKDRNTAAVLEAIGAEQDSEEHMMECCRRIFLLLSGELTMRNLRLHHPAFSPMFSSKLWISTGP